MEILGNYRLFFIYKTVQVMSFQKTKKNEKHLNFFSENFINVAKYDIINDVAEAKENVQKYTDEFVESCQDSGKSRKF